MWSKASLNITSEFDLMDLLNIELVSGFSSLSSDTLTHSSKIYCTPWWNQSIVWIGKDLTDHLVPTRCHDMVSLSLNQAAQGSIQLALNVARDGASAACLSSLCQCLSILQVNNIILISNLNIQFFSCLKILILVQLLHTPQRVTESAKLGKTCKIIYPCIYFEFQHIFSCNEETKSIFLSKPQNEYISNKSDKKK